MTHDGPQNLLSRPATATPQPQTQHSHVAAAMAVAQQQQAKAKAAAPVSAPTKQSTAAQNKAKAQMHRRSRTGCYTCRLRRKKCDEGSPCCSACKNLGLVCNYKRPLWWSNCESRRWEKDNIKVIIKRKKLNEKASSGTSNNGKQGNFPNTPPSLSHSLPTSATFSDPLDRTRSTSIDSFSALDYDFTPAIADFGFTPSLHSSHSDFGPGMYPQMPYEVDVKTERQIYMNDSLTRRESTISTFSTFQPPPPDAVLPSYPASAPCEWVGDMYSEERRESFSEEIIDPYFFGFDQGPPTATPANVNLNPVTARNIDISLSDSDRNLLEHFTHMVLPSIFPILELQPASSPLHPSLMLPALQTNPCYLSCCLSIAAQHYKASILAPTGADTAAIDEDIMRHRYATISALCSALNADENHAQILEATLGMIFFACSVGSGAGEDGLPDIPWHQHFQAAVSLVQKLELPQTVMSSLTNPAAEIPFQFSHTAWIDILGSTLLGRAPYFAHTYREKHLSHTNPSLGLRDLMGCDDRVMYLISEISCLDALKSEGMGDLELCRHVHSLGDQIGLTELSADPEAAVPKIPFTGNGRLVPEQLKRNVTAAFRIAARIYLCSLVPGFHPSQASCVGLVQKLTNALEFIPSGPTGFDRSLVWVYLIGGSVSTAASPFRSFFTDRVVELGDAANVGSFGRVKEVLNEVWTRLDSGCTPGGTASGYVSWRNVMQERGWDFLLI